MQMFVMHWGLVIRAISLPESGLQGQRSSSGSHCQALCSCQPPSHRSLYHMALTTHFSKDSWPFQFFFFLMVLRSLQSWAVLRLPLYCLPIPCKLFPQDLFYHIILCTQRGSFRHSEIFHFDLSADRLRKSISIWQVILHPFSIKLINPFLLTYHASHA